MPIEDFALACWSLAQENFDLKHIEDLTAQSFLSVTTRFRLAVTNFLKLLAMELLNRGGVSPDEARDSALAKI